MNVRNAALKLTVRDATIQLLRSFGMTTFFGNPGSTELPFFKDFPQDFRYILGLQESSVVAMADGFAQATRGAAFVNLHSATGLGHALGSVFTAYRNQTPLVITAGQQARAMMPTEPFLYAKSATEFPRPYVKWSCEPARAEDVPAAIARAYYFAMHKPCGPTYVSIPMDDWGADASPFFPRAISREFAPAPGALQQLADALNAAKRPALIVGPGVDCDGAWDLAVELAERIASPVWASPMSSRGSFPEDHRLFAGFLPPQRQLLSNKLVGHDVVVVAGAPIFTYHVHAEGNFVPPGTRIFQITDDPEAASFAPVGTSILCSIRLGLAQLLEHLLTTERLPSPSRVSPRPPEAIEPISGEFVMHTVAQAMPREAIIVEEAPSHRNAMHDYLPIRKSQGFYTCASGGLGYGLPAAVGVALADTSRRVICLVGDGSSLYSIQALWSAAQHQLPITFVVLNNAGYSALKAFARILDAGNPPGVDLPGIDFLAIARGFGCSALRVEKAADLAAVLSRSFATRGPTLIDVPVDRSILKLY